MTTPDPANDGAPLEFSAADVTAAVMDGLAPPTIAAAGVKVFTTTVNAYTRIQVAKIQAHVPHVHADRDDIGTGEEA